MGSDSTKAPADYDALYRDYYKYVCSLVRKFGIDEGSKEDVASSILLRFYERDFLHEFNPDLEFTYRGEKRPARFKSFLNAFVELYVRHHRDRQRTLKEREPLVCDHPTPDGGVLLDMFADPIDPGFGEVDAGLDMGIFLEALRGKLSWDSENLEFLDTVIAEVERTGKVRLVDVQRALGLGRNNTKTKMMRLRKAAAEVLAEQQHLGWAGA